MFSSVCKSKNRKQCQSGHNTDGSVIDGLVVLQGGPHNNFIVRVNACDHYIKASKSKSIEILDLQQQISRLFNWIIYLGIYMYYIISSFENMKQNCYRLFFLVLNTVLNELQLLSNIKNVLKMLTRLGLKRLW